MERPNADGATIQGTVSHEAEFFDTACQIRRTELEAYGAVLTAFHAQSDSISWGKEWLMTELRKELGVTDDEHREMLERIDSDHLAKLLREQHNAQNLTTAYPLTSDLMPIGHASFKRLKPAQKAVTTNPKYLPQAQPLRTPFAAHVRDDRQVGTRTEFLSQTHAAAGQAVTHDPQRRHSSTYGEVTGSMAVLTAKDIRSGCENIKPDPDVIEICATDKPIQEAENVCHGVNCVPVQFEREKLTIREHERALMEVIGKLADVPDDDYSLERWKKQHSGEERERNARGTPNVGCEQLDRYAVPCRKGRGTMQRSAR